LIVKLITRYERSVCLAVFQQLNGYLTTKENTSIPYVIASFCFLSYLFYWLFELGKPNGEKQNKSFKNYGG